MQQRGGECRERHDAEQYKRARRTEEPVERIGRIDDRECHDRAGRGENARDVGVFGVDRVAADLAPARPFAGRDQRGREQAAEEDAHAGADQAGLDRILHHEDAAERERKSADPHDPARAEALLEAFRRRRGFGRRRWRRRCARVADDLVDGLFVEALRCGGRSSCGFCRSRRGNSRRGFRCAPCGRGGGRRCAATELRNALLKLHNPLAGVAHHQDGDQRQNESQKLEHDSPGPNGVMLHPRACVAPAYRQHFPWSRRGSLRFIRVRQGAGPGQAARTALHGGTERARPAGRRSRSRFRRSARPARRFPRGGGSSACAPAGPRSPRRCAAIR